MSKVDKLRAQLAQGNHTFSWLEMVALLQGLGFTQEQGQGSRVCFRRAGLRLRLHRPHPQRHLKPYAQRLVKELLKKEGLL